MTKSPLTGQILGRFELRRELGRGGMGVVYQALQADLDRLVAVKVLAPELTHDETYVQRFRQEARSAARLEHPNIIPIFDVGEHEGLHYIAMKYVQGHTLKELLKRDGILPIPQAVEILSQVASALDHAHQHDIIHRDIKSSNIMISENGWVYLTDFGLARGQDHSTGLTRTGTVMGTPEYMSPEQAKGEVVIGAQSDIYSLGVVLYEMLTCAFPFEAETPLGILSARLLEEPRSPLERRQDLPTPVADVILRTLARDPAMRYATATDMVAALCAAAALPEPQRRSHPTTPSDGVTPILSPIPLLHTDNDITPCNRPSGSTPPQSDPISKDGQTISATSWTDHSRSPAPNGNSPEPLATPVTDPDAPTISSSHLSEPDAVTLADQTLPQLDSSSAPATAHNLPPPPQWRSSFSNIIPSFWESVPPFLKQGHCLPKMVIGGIVLLIIGILLLLAFLGGTMFGKMLATFNDAVGLGSAEQPSEILRHLTQADAMLQDKGDLAEIAHRYDDILQIDPYNMPALTRGSLLASLRGDHTLALDYAQRAIDVDDQSADAHAARAFALWLKGNEEEAISMAHKSIGIDPANAFGYAVRALIRADRALSSKDHEAWQAARDDARTANEHSADQHLLIAALAHYSQGYVAWHHHSQEENRQILLHSEQEFRNAIELLPQAAMFHTDLASLYHDIAMMPGRSTKRRLEFLQKAERQVEAAIDYDNSYMPAYLTLGWSYYHQGIESSNMEDLDEAIDHFTRALELDPQAPGAHRGIGWALYNQAKYWDAKNAFETATNQDPTDANAFLGLGQALQQLGQKDRAREALQHAIELDPDSDAKVILQRLEYSE